MRFWVSTHCLRSKVNQSSGYHTHIDRMMRKHGLGFIPENPLTMATVPFMSVLENIGHHPHRGICPLSGFWHGLEPGAGRYPGIPG